MLGILGLAACCGGGAWYFMRQAGGLVGVSGSTWYVNVMQGNYAAAADMTVGGESEAKALATKINDEFGNVVPTGQEMLDVDAQVSSDGQTAEVPIAVNGSKASGTALLHMELGGDGMWRVEDVSFEDVTAK